MICRVCGSRELQVLESRDIESRNAIRRRRKCKKCFSRFTTYESQERIHILVVKKNNTRESFSREKLSGGIYKAFEKRPLSASQIEELITYIEEKLHNLPKTEVKSSVLGEMVMQEIKKRDDVAYVRFASVYRSFTDIASFEKELTKIKKEQNN